MPPPDASRQYGRRPGTAPFLEGIYLIGWEDRSTWGYDETLGGFYALLQPNGSTSDEPEISLSCLDRIYPSRTYPWPSCIVLGIVERTHTAPLAVVRGMGVADPNPTLRPRDEIMGRIKDLGGSKDHTRFVTGQLHALGWTVGLAEFCPGSGLRSGTAKPSPAQVDAEHHMVTGRVYRGEDRDLYSGADTGLWWALGRN
ncbi:MAG: hypothetical protein ACRDRI_05545 [Pseudonocardiaceae bacterium]